MTAVHAPSILAFNSAERVFSVLIASAYRKSSLAKMDLSKCRPAMLATLRRRTKMGLPVQLTVLAFPFKVPNPAKVGERRLPDFAELAAIRHLGSLRDAVQRIYPPGLEFHILHDGSLIRGVFGIESQEVHQYETYFAGLVAEDHASHFIRCHDFRKLQQRSGFDTCGSIEQLRLAAKRWWQRHYGTAEWKCSFQKTLGMINVREFSVAAVTIIMKHAIAGRLPPEYARLEQRVHEAMVQYHVQDAVIHQFDPRPYCFPDAIHATTRERRGRLSIWMVRRGQSLLPWHGVGCLDALGRPQVVHAAQVSEKYCPEFIGGENAPFRYRQLAKSTTTDLALPNRER